MSLFKIPWFLNSLRLLVFQILIVIFAASWRILLDALHRIRVHRTFGQLYLWISHQVSGCWIFNFCILTLEIFGVSSFKSWTLSSLTTAGLSLFISSEEAMFIGDSWGEAARSSGGTCCTCRVWFLTWEGLLVFILGKRMLIFFCSGTWMWMSRGSRGIESPSSLFKWTDTPLSMERVW